MFLVNVSVRFRAEQGNSILLLLNPRAFELFVVDLEQNVSYLHAPQSVQFLREIMNAEFFGQFGKKSYWPILRSYK